MPAFVFSSWRNIKYELKRKKDILNLTSVLCDLLLSALREASAMKPNADHGLSRLKPQRAQHALL